MLQQCCVDIVPKGLDQALIQQMKMSQITALNNMIATEPNNALLYVNRAKFFMDNRMGKEALADLKKACDLEPENKMYKSYFNELNSSFPH
jgi:predicted Zn-dependent protease